MVVLDFFHSTYMYQAYLELVYDQPFSYYFEWKQKNKVIIWFFFSDIYKVT